MARHLSVRLNQQASMLGWEFAMPTLLPVAAVVKETKVADVQLQFDEIAFAAAVGMAPAAELAQEVEEENKP